MQGDEVSNKVFFSYARADSAFAIRLAKDLRNTGISIWLDELNIKGGTRWDLEVQKALESSPCVLIIISPTSINSNNVMDEISFALDENKTIIPVLLKECNIPLRLRRFQRIDFINDYNLGFDNLVSALNDKGLLNAKLISLEEKEKVLGEESIDKTNKQEKKLERTQKNENERKERLKELIREKTFDNFKLHFAVSLFKKRYVIIAGVLLGVVLVAIVYFMMFYQTSRIPLKTFNCKAAVTSVAFSPNGKYILAGAEDGRTRLWDLGGKQILELNCNGKVNSVTFSPDGKYILTAQDTSTKLWNLRGQLVQQFPGHTRWVNAAAFSPDGKYIITASHDSTARLWDMNGRMLLLFKADNIIVDATFSQVNKLILTGGLLWDFKGNLIRKFDRADDCATFSPNGQLILTGNDYNIHIWNLQGMLLYDIKNSGKLVHTARFSPDGEHILIGFNFDGTAVLSDLYGNIVHRFIGGDNITISSVSFSPDGKYLLTGSWNNTVKLWEVHLSSN